MQLHRTAQALSRTLFNEADELFKKESEPTAHVSLFCAQGLCYSALLILYDRYCCVSTTGTSDYAELQKTAVSGLIEVSTSVFDFASSIRNAMELGGSLQMSPLVIDCLYQAAANLLWHSRETGHADCSPMAIEIENVLRVLGIRWRSPSK